MRVAMVSEHASPLAALGGVDAGGQNVHVAALARAMAAEGHDVIVYTRRDDPHLPDRVCTGPGVVVEHLSAGPAVPVPKEEMLPYMEELGVGLARAFDARRPDIVHSHFWMSGYACLEANRHHGLPLAHTFHALGCVRRRHQGAADKSPPERDEIERALIRHADRLICTCTDEVFELRRQGAGAGRMSVIPCGVDLETFRPNGPVEESRSGRPRLVVLSRMVPRKGIDLVIEALTEVPEAELVIAGGPPPGEHDADPELRRLRDVAARVGVAERVDFRGAVPRAEVPALLRSSDALVTTPWYEPFGITPLEAMACGVPVVAAAVGGLIDTVVDGVTGLHVPPRQPAVLAAALNELLDRPLLRRRMGAAGALRAHARYSWERVARLTLETYSQMLAPLQRQEAR